MLLTCASSPSEGHIYHWCIVQFVVELALHSIRYTCCHLAMRLHAPHTSHALPYLLLVCCLVLLATGVGPGCSIFGLTGSSGAALLLLLLLLTSGAGCLPYL